MAKCCAEGGYDLLLAADQPLEEAALDCRALGAAVETLQVDLASEEGVDRLIAALGDRPVGALLANAGHGLGKGFLEQDFAAIRHVIDTNITGTVYLLHQLGNRMRGDGGGKVLIAGSIAGFMPGSFQAVYNGTKAFIDSFAAAWRNEMKDTGVTVTCLMPGATDTEFFVRADMLDTKVGTEQKMDPAEVAKIGFDAMQSGEADVVAGLKNKLQVMMTKVLPSQMLAEEHRKQAEPGTAEKPK
ncbi:SDR family NAD(P)-dependent oxidoreductase [Variovorax rhizosphaerae]|uniref:SDR family NAD(P)-dependent oxidoreductase n=1 Tax=Variovorax rhizosphaerae TaxID=1836200 RepID=A0ABU8WY69_9BURK